MSEATNLKTEVDTTTQIEPAKGEVTYTREEIKSYLNNDFMTGTMSATEFLNIMLEAAYDEEVEQYALRALTISLGDLSFSSMMANSETRRIIYGGPKNDKTQSIATSLTPEHLARLRELVGKSVFAEEPYLLSLQLAPQVASTEDIHLILSRLRGESSILTRAVDPSRPWYYPKVIHDEIKTLDDVIKSRPDLVDEPTIQITKILPGMIEEGQLVPRKAYDHGITKELILEAATGLQHSVNHQSVKKLS